MNETMGPRLEFAADGPGGLPAFRNGERVSAAFQVGADLYVILCERAAFEFVTAVTHPGRDGWDGGHYFTYGMPPRPLDAGRRLAALGRAQADFLARCMGYLGPEVLGSVGRPAAAWSDSDAQARMSDGA